MVTDPQDLLAIIMKRIKQGCPACGRAWSEKDIASNFPALGISCSRCYSEHEACKETP